MMYLQFVRYIEFTHAVQSLHTVWLGLKGNVASGGYILEQAPEFPGASPPSPIPTPSCKSVPFSCYLPCAGRELERLSHWA